MMVNVPDPQAEKTLLPPVSPGHGNPIHTSQGCVDCIKTCCVPAMSGRRYAIIHSDPPAYCLTISPAASWSWFAGGRLPKTPWGDTSFL